MADQKRWFKVWSSITSDPDHANLSLENVGRWARLGALIVANGTNGSIDITAPAKMILTLMEVDSLESLKTAMESLPNVSVTWQFGDAKNDKSKLRLIMRNWSKYQRRYDSYKFVKNSRTRMKKKKKEEKKEEKNQKKKEKKKEEDISLSLFSEKETAKSSSHRNHAGFDKFWIAYPRKIAKGAALRAWQKNVPKMPGLDHVLAAIEDQINSKQWQDGFIPNPATWINGHRWHDIISPKDIKGGATDDLPVE